jgi:hypothetical protein
MLQFWSIRILIACVVVFFLQVMIVPLTDSLVLVSADVLSHPWTLMTSMFAHADFNHLFYNMFALFLFGAILERIIGGRNFLLVYFFAGLVGSLATIPLYEASLGASGAIFGIIGALTVLRPRMTIYVYYVPMPMAIAGLVYALIDIVGIFVPSGVANAAHLAGLAVGIAAGLLLRNDYGETPAPASNPPKIPEGKMRNWEDRWLIGKKA